MKLIKLSEDEIARLTSMKTQNVYAGDSDIEDKDMDSVDSDSSIIDADNPLDLLIPSASTGTHTAEHAGTLDLSMQEVSSKVKSLEKMTPE